ncbi:hypothetical protein MVEN_00116000 [Mycena venus]|uniref:Uncharacterized protein n=1 Tax=Mycena venus TaxID=2733690 RepID=A0A8H7DGR3_9AGAR|nr:hypothetical protein MVEN_00116000 [Mycena venus]
MARRAAQCMRPRHADSVREDRNPKRLGGWGIHGFMKELPPSINDCASRIKLHLKKLSTIMNLVESARGISFSATNQNATGCAVAILGFLLYCVSASCCRCFKSLHSTTTMNPASPLPASPSTKPSKRQRLKNFFHDLFKSSSRKASTSMPALHVYHLAAMSDQILLAHGIAEELYPGSRPSASLNDNGDRTITPQTANCPSPARTSLNELPSTGNLPHRVMEAQPADIAIVPSERPMIPEPADSPSPSGRH